MLDLDDVELELDEILELDSELLEVTLELVGEVLDLEEELLDVDDAGSVGVLLLTVPVGGIPVAGGVQLLPGHPYPYDNGGTLATNVNG